MNMFAVQLLRVLNIGAIVKMMDTWLTHSERSIGTSHTNIKNENKKK